MYRSKNFRNKKIQPQYQPKKTCFACQNPTSALCEGSRESWFQHSKETEDRRDAKEKATLEAEMEAARKAEIAEHEAATATRKIAMEAAIAAQEAAIAKREAERKAEIAERKAAILVFKNKLAELLNCSLEFLESLIESGVFTDKIILEFMEHGFYRKRTGAMIYPRFATSGFMGVHMSDPNTVSLHAFFESPSAAYDKMPKEIKKLCDMNSNTMILEDGCAILMTLVDGYYTRKISFLKNGVVVYTITEIRDRNSSFCDYFNSDYEIQRFKEDPINKLGDNIAENCSIM